MKKLIFAICLALLSFNANARCFEGDLKDPEFFQCTVAEGIRAIDSLPNGFVSHIKGYLLGCGDVMAMATIAQGKQTFGCDGNYSVQLIHDIMYDKVKKGEVGLDMNYHLSMGNTLAERFYKCLADNEAKQQKQ